MKKIIIVLIAILLLAGIGIGVYLKLPKEQVTIGSEAVLPEKPIVFIKGIELQKSFDKFAGTDLWGAFSDIDYEKVLQNGKGNERQKLFLRSINEFFKDNQYKVIFDKIFENEVAIAMYPFDLNVSTIDIENLDIQRFLFETIFTNFTLVMKMSPDVQFFELISRPVQQVGKTVTKDTYEYKGQTVNKFTIEGLPADISYFKYDDYLVLGVGDKAVKSAIDIKEGEMLPLSSDSKFIEVSKKGIGSSDLGAYVDLAQLREKFESVIRGYLQLNLSAMTEDESFDADQIEENMDMFFDKVEAFESWTLAGDFDSDLEFKSNLFFDEAGLDYSLQALVDCKVSENRSINFTPDDILVYFRQGCFDIPKFVEEVKKNIAQSKDPKAQAVLSGMNSTSQIAGLSVEAEILPAFGTVFGAFLKDVKSTGVFPIPELSLFISLNDKDVIEQLLGLLRGLPLVVLNDQEHSGVNFVSAQTPLGSMLEPGYCFIDDYLMIATSTSVIKSSIDVLKGDAKSLKQAGDYEKYLGKSVGSVYVDMDRFAEKMGTVVDWGEDKLTEKDEKLEAFKSGSEKRLADVQKRIARKENELEDAENEITVIDDEIFDMELQAVDTTQKKDELLSVENEIVRLKKEIASAVDQEKDLDRIVQEYETKSGDSAFGGRKLGESVSPLIDILKSMDLFLTTTIKKLNELETNILIKLK